MDDFISIGQIINIHGVKGEIKVYPLTDNIKRFRKLEKIYVDGKQINVVWCKLQPSTVIMKLENIDSVEEALKYKNKYITVERKDAVKLPEGRYFVTDIIGCMVYDTSNTPIGKINEIIFTGSNDVYWIKGDKEVLIPAIKDVVVNIDVQNKKVIIKPLEVWQ